MEGRCTECNNHNVALHHYQTHLCYNCYETLFSRLRPMPNPFENEPDEGPDFVLEKEIASYERSNRYDIKNVIYSKDPFDGKIQFVGNSNAIKLPKQFVFNPDARVKDYDKLIKFLLDNTVIQENAIGFDKVRYMFKEVE